MKVLGLRVSSRDVELFKAETAFFNRRITDVQKIEPMN